MFIDEAKIHIKAGDGGNGRKSFRREKFVAHGGPDGGDGGDGGNVVFVVNINERTLIMFRHRQNFKAQRGNDGESSNKYGRSGKDIEIPVPLGTIVRNDETGDIIADLSDQTDRVVMARGGRGGRGNSHFATAVNQTPLRADPGRPGEELTLHLELKLLADVGLVGLPNAGKSTLLSRVSAAHPKIADYPFTTLQPNLGIVTWGEGNSFVMADIPGIIEGAHEGKGLGHQFLKHIERTAILVFLIQCTEEDPSAVYRTLLDECALFSPELLEKPRIAILTKTDLLSPDERPKEPFVADGVETFAISAVSGDGIHELVHRLGARVQSDKEAGRSRVV